jgi:hypothetical protein
MEFIKSPIVMIVVALLMLILGFVLPFLMMMRILESTILLNFVAYLVSIFGLVLGTRRRFFLHASRRQRK